MFEDILAFLVFFLASYAIKLLVFRRDIGPFKTIFCGLGLVGVLVNELSHKIMCILCRVPSEDFTVRYWNDLGRVSPNGHVRLKEGEKISFMQSVLISLAPLMACTWLFIWAIGFAFDVSQIGWYRILAGFACVSVLIGAQPSHADFSQISAGYGKDPSYATYQALLVLISCLITYFLLVVVYKTEYHEAVNYLAIGLVYAVLKYSLMGINYLGRLIFVVKPSRNRINYKAYTKKSLRPKSSGRIGKRDGDW